MLDEVVNTVTKLFASPPPEDLVQVLPECLLVLFLVWQSRFDQDLHKLGPSQFCSSRLECPEWPAKVSRLKAVTQEDSRSCRSEVPGWDDGMGVEYCSKKCSSLF